MKCNSPRRSWLPHKKRVVKACQNGREKIVHYGAVGYGHNYSPEARKSFRARHKCDSAKDKLTARYWACQDLWVKGGDTQKCPKNRRCKGKKSRRKSRKKSRRKNRQPSRRKSRKKSRKNSRRKSRRKSM